MASNRQRLNLIHSVIVEGVRYEDPAQVKQAVVNHFRKHFSENWTLMPQISGPFAIITSEAVVSLEAVFTEEEIWAAIHDCDGNKAPGPDGFNLTCIQKCWKIMKGDIMQMLHEFHTNGKLSRVNQQFGEFYGDHFRIKVGNGGRIMFWYDTWLNNRDLQVQFPRLYSLSTEKEETRQQISAKKSNLGLWQLSFRGQLFVWEAEELQRLMGLLETSTLGSSDCVDSCSWLANSSGQFSVSSMRRWWDTAIGTGQVVPKGVWVGLAPPKVQFFCWLAWRGKVKTSNFLQRIGVLHASVNNICVFCQADVESLNHVLLFCPPVWKCWSQMVRWSDQVLAICGSVQGLLQWWSAGKSKHWISRL
ncbi:hypothetical protein ACSBR2_034130 [Camellia fascicularis]